MKLTLKQLDAHLQKTLSPLYFIASADPELTQQAVQSIRQAALQQQFTDRYWFCPSTHEDWEHITGLQKNFDLFNTKQMIEIFLSGGKLGQTGIPYLQKCIDKLNPDQIFVITTDKLDKSLLSSRWLMQCEKAGVLITIWSAAENLIQEWLQLLLNRNIAKSMQALSKLQEQQIEPTWIVWQLAQAIRNQPPKILTAMLPIIYQLDLLAKGNPLIHYAWPDFWCGLKDFSLQLQRQYV